jgi:hypothetical protein
MALWAIICWSGSVGYGLAEQPTPNVILILTDDQ